jgi:hypothetical protein
VAVTATPSGSAIGIGIRRRDGIGAVVGIVIRIGLGSGSGSGSGIGTGIGTGIGSGIDRDHCSRSPSRSKRWRSRCLRLPFTVTRAHLQLDDAGLEEACGSGCDQRDFEAHSLGAPC